MYLKKLLQLAARNASRNKTRTMLTAGMVTAGTGLLTVALSGIGGIWADFIVEGTEAFGHVRVVDPDFADREQFLPIYENLEESEPLLEAVAAVEGVTEVHPRIITGVTVTVGEEIGDVFGLVLGAPDAFMRGRMGIDEKLFEGRWYEGDDELVLGYRLADQAGASIGDEVVLLGQTQHGSLSPIAGTLVGIVRAGNPLIDQQAFVTFEKARWLTDIPDGAIELVVYGDSYLSAGGLASAISALPGFEELAVQAWYTREPWMSMLPMMIGILGMLVFVLVFMAALGVWNTMMMSVLERTSEIGVLRALGMTRGATVILFVVEASAIAIIGGLTGVLLGAGPAYWFSKNGLELSEELTNNIDLPMQNTMQGTFSIEILVACFLLGLSMAILGSLLPAVRAALIQPVTAMRSGR